MALLGTLATWPWPADPGAPLLVTAPMLAGWDSPAPLRSFPSSGFQPDLGPFRRTCSTRLGRSFRELTDNPPGVVIEHDFFARLVAFARRHEIIVVQ